MSADAADLRGVLEVPIYTPTAPDSLRQAIYAELLDRSRYLKQGNFEQIHPSDLELLFTAYDQRFFKGAVRQALGKKSLAFSLSSRMTRAGGKTYRMLNTRTGERSYEIRASTAILFESFTQKDHRPIVVCGRECRDRLDALQRIFEHELIHLVEMLVWDRSNCAQSRFQSITRRFFLHTDHRHELITPREKARVEFGVQVGARVRFQYDGRIFTGVVNRVQKRATVLVESPRGMRYTDGKHYEKYYVPVSQLEVLAAKIP